MPHLHKGGDREHPYGCDVDHDDAQFGRGGVADHRYDDEGRRADEDITVQATITFRVADPAVAASRIDFGIDPDTGAWRARPLEQVGGLLTELAQQHALDLLA